MEEFKPQDLAVTALSFARAEPSLAVEACRSIEALFPISKQCYEVGGQFVVNHVRTAYSLLHQLLQGRGYVVLILRTALLCYRVKCMVANQNNPQFTATYCSCSYSSKA